VGSPNALTLAILPAPTIAKDGVVIHAPSTHAPLAHEPETQAGEFTQAPRAFQIAHYP
jgi:hypothetical protein